MFILEGLITSIVFNVILAFLSIRYYSAWQEARKQSAVDSLTGLLNRDGLDISVRNIYGRFKREEVQSVSVAVIDLDNFKPVNDQYGHKVGDEVLKRFAEMLITETRETDLVARTGGDEYALVFIDTDAKTVHRIFDRVREKLETYPFPFTDVNLSFSVGVKKTSNSKTPFPTVLEQADRKCLRRKARNGKGR